MDKEDTNKTAEVQPKHHSGTGKESVPILPAAAALKEDAEEEETA
jgi:hypothetical protein